MLSHIDFLALVDKYHNDSAFLSHHNTKHEAFQELLSYGKDIIPYLTIELLKCNSWLPIVLLSFIIGDNKNSYLHYDMRGNFDLVNDAWIKWASDNGYDKYMVLF